MRAETARFLIASVGEVNLHLSRQTEISYGYKTNSKHRKVFPVEGGIRL